MISGGARRKTQEVSLYALPAFCLPFLRNVALIVLCKTCHKNLHFLETASWLRPVRQRTWERYEQIVRVHLKPVLGRIKFKNLTTTHTRPLPREARHRTRASYRELHTHHALQ